MKTQLIRCLAVAAIAALAALAPASPASAGDELNLGADGSVIKWDD